MSTLEKDWKQYINALRNIDADFPKGLKEGIANDNLKELNSVLNHPASHQLLQFLSLVNGQKINSLPIFFGFSLLSGQEIKRIYNEKNHLISFAQNFTTSELLVIDLEQNGQIFGRLGEQQKVIALSINDLVLLLTDHLELNLFIVSPEMKELSILEGESVIDSLHNEFIDNYIQSQNTSVFYKYEKENITFQLPVNYTLDKSLENSATVKLIENALFFVDTFKIVKNTFININSDEEFIVMGIDYNIKQLSPYISAEAIINNYQKQIEMSGIPMNLNTQLEENVKGFDLFLRLECGFPEQENIFLYYFGKEYTFHVTIPPSVGQQNIQLIINSIKTMPFNKN